MPEMDAVEADLVLANARVWTPGWTKPIAAAIAVGGDKILRVGSNAQCEAQARRGALILDLGGRLAIPGFVDAHAHVMHTGPRLDWLQLQEVRSKRQLLSILKRACARTRRGSWILGRGWDESRWPERSYPTRSELDRVAGGKPVLIRRVDGHMSVVDTAALRLLRLPPGTPGFEKDAAGRPTGILRETAGDMAGERTRPSVSELVKAFPRMLDTAHRLGITSIHDVVDERGLEAYAQLTRRAALGLRVCLMPLIGMQTELEKHRRDYLGGRLRLGALKGFSDGSLGARTAALREPYADAASERGLLAFRGNGLRIVVANAHRAGFQVAMHAIGDRAIDSVIDSYESALRGNPRPDHRHRIEHFELPSDEAIDRCGRLGIIPVMQPNFVEVWGQPGGMYEARLGRSRERRNNPHRLFLRRGLRFAFGSDGMPYGPIYGLQGAVHAPHPDQRIGLSDALEAYTLGGAFASFEEGIKGRIAQGYLADIAVIDGAWGGPGRFLGRWNVVATIAGGMVVYRSKGIKTL